MAKYTIINFINKLSKLLCHQKKTRCFKINGYCMPICSRCTGILISFILTLTLLSFNIYINIYISILLFIPMLIDWSLQAFKIKSSNNIRRFITGFFGGLGMCYIFYYFIMFLFNLLNIR